MRFAHFGPKTGFLRWHFEALSAHCLSWGTCSFIFRPSLYTSSGCLPIMWPSSRTLLWDHLPLRSGVNVNELTDGPQGRGEKYECLNIPTATRCSSNPEVKDYIRFPSRGIRCGTTEAGAGQTMSYSSGAGGLPRWLSSSEHYLDSNDVICTAARMLLQKVYSLGNEQTWPWSHRIADKVFEVKIVTAQESHKYNVWIEFNKMGNRWSYS